MDAGKLRHRIILQRRGTSRDEYGEKPDTWTTLATVWASIDALNVREVEFARGIAATVTHKIVMRYHAGLRPSDRVVFQGRNLLIDGIINVSEQNKELNLYCTEEVAQ